MISIKRCKLEKRGRDRIRNRLILTIGTNKYHITREEARKLRNQLNRFKLEG